MTDYAAPNRTSIQEAEKKVEAGARQLENTMRGELAKLDKPMDQLPPGSS